MRKIGLLSLALILALGTLGVGYALWYEDLFIVGTVNTGTLDATWSIGDYGADGDTKNVSEVGMSISQDGHTLTLTVDNAYPSVVYYWNFDITNTGTIPIHVGQFVIDWDGIPAVAFVLQDQSLDYGLTWEGPDQLHAGDSGWGEIWLHFDNTALENHQYTFNVNLSVGQYNEFDIGAPPVN